MGKDRDRINLLNNGIDRVDLAEACRRVNEFVRLGRPQQVVTANLDFLRLSTQDHSFQDLINTAGLVVPDGMPLVWAARLLGDPLPGRVAGVDLVLECARLAADKGYRIFLLGAAPGVADRAATVLRERFPDLKVAGTHSPPSLSADHDSVSLARIHAVKPDMLFVAFGAPRQDFWIRKHMHTLGVPVCMGVGATLDVLSGRVNRAPAWMQRTGLEWFYRFLSEPGRLWKRYFVYDLPVAVRLLAWAGFGSSGRPVPQPLHESSVLDTGEVPPTTTGVLVQ